MAPADEYMQEYAALKASLLDTTRKSGAAVATYLLFAVSGQAAICGLIGTGFSNLYLLWLFRDLDAIKGTDSVPMLDAKDIENPVQRYFTMWLCSYYYALRPRLLVPVSLAALMAAYNSIAEQPLGGFEEAALLLGFLSHKAALLLKVFSEISVKPYSEESYRPTIDRFDENEELNLDRWGRPVKPQFTMPTEVLPEDVDTNNMGLLPTLLAEGAKSMTDDDDASPAPSQRPPPPPPPA